MLDKPCAWKPRARGARRFYNSCLAERKEAFEERGETIGKFAQLGRVKDEKKSNPYATGIHSHVLQVVVSDLDKAFQSFFGRVKSKEKAGYPRFRGFNRFDSFGFKENGNGFKVDGRRLKLSGIGRVPVRWHRPIEGKIKSLRIVKKADGWYAIFACEVESMPLPATGQSVGVDVGIESLLTLSDGTRVENPKWYRKSQAKLRVLQRTVARRKKGGMNRRKAVKRLQVQHQRIENTRKDCLNKVAHNLVQNYDVIVLERPSHQKHGAKPSFIEKHFRCRLGLSRSTSHAQGRMCRSCDRVCEPRLLAIDRFFDYTLVRE